MLSTCRVPSSRPRKSTSSLRHVPMSIFAILFIISSFNSHHSSSFVQAASRGAYDEIASNPDLSKFKEWIDQDKILVLMMQERDLTLMAPTNQAIQTFLDKNPNLDTKKIKNLANYHTLSASIKRDQFPRTAASSNGKYAPIHLSVRTFSPFDTNGQSQGNAKFYYINNAFVLDAREDLQSPAGNPQSLFIIDEVLPIYEPTSSVAPNALEFIRNPSVYDMGDLDLSHFYRHIQDNKLEDLFARDGRNTFFVPSKQSLGSAAEFNAYVVRSHVVSTDALFVRTLGDKIKYPTLSYDGKVDVELSLINTTSRFSSEKVYFIQTNTLKNEDQHKVGKVLSRLALANIPIKNGVIHIIDKPLMIMDMSIRDFLRNQSKLSRFYKLLEKHQDVLSELNRNPNKTILAPDDNAFENLINNNQNFSEIEESSDEIKKLLRSHVVFTSVSSASLKKSNNYASYKSASNVSVGFRLVGSDPNPRLTIESGGVNASSTQSDFGASDGILHIIDRVLGMPFKTLREKLRTQTLLKETFKIGTQGGAQNWNGKLADENKRYTFFAPSDQAWVQFAKENPSEFKQLDTELYPPISRAILDRHLSAKGQYNKKDLLQTVKKVESIQGDLIISPDPISREIYVEWEGIKAKIIQSDILGLNGVIHVIDTVLAKRRDFSVNSAPILSGCHHFVYMTFGLVAVYLNNRMH